MMKVRKCVFGDVDAKSLEYVFLDWHPDLLGGGVVILGQLAVSSLRRGKVSTKIRR